MTTLGSNHKFYLGAQSKGDPILFRMIDGIVSDKSHIFYKTGAHMSSEKFQILALFNHF
jgi:hypothetical protein